MQPLLIQTVFRTYAESRIITQQFRQCVIKQKSTFLLLNILLNYLRMNEHIITLNLVQEVVTIKQIVFSKLLFL